MCHPSCCALPHPAKPTQPQPNPNPINPAHARLWAVVAGTRHAPLAAAVAGPLRRDFGEQDAKAVCGKGVRARVQEQKVTCSRGDLQSLA